MPVLALARRRLNQGKLARLAWVLAALAALAVILGALGDDATTVAEASELIAELMGLLAWGGAACLGLAAAGPSIERDSREGLEALVVLGGGSVRTLRVSRWLAAAYEGARRVLVPAFVACLALGLATKSLLIASHLPGIAAFGVLVGAVMGLVGAACSELGGQRGRSLFFLALLVPWLMSQASPGLGFSAAELVERGVDLLVRPMAHVGACGSGSRGGA